jgi:tight adherence protein B
MSQEILLLLALIFAILLAGVVTILGLINVLSASDDVVERIQRYAAIREESSPRRRGRTRLVRWRAQLNSVLSILTSEELNLRLLSANWPITETEYILIRAWGLIGGLLGGWFFFGSILPGIGLGILAFLVPEVLLRRSIYSRRLRFEKQLVDVLVLIKGAVSAGVSFLQALDLVVQEMTPPASEEFRRVRREVGLGLPLSQALNNLHARMQNDDLYLLITAVNINAQVGGNLSTMLEAVTNTIRERIRLFGEVRALTAMQRYSGYMLTLLPFITASILFVLNPKYISSMFKPGPILCIPIGALILVILGNILIRVMARVEV